MNAELSAIKTAYENENMTPEEIAELRGLDVVAVKGGLMQCSSKYRKDCGKEDEEDDELNFSKDEQRRIKEAILDLAMSTEDPHLKFKALVYCRDDAKGRKDTVKVPNGAQINILNINERLQQVRKLADQAKQIAKDNKDDKNPPIDV